MENGSPVMPCITYVERNGTAHKVDVEIGLSVMRGAIDAGIEGIEAVCGGQCACATCHCLVDEAWISRLPLIDELEDEMLDEVTAGRTPMSRLGCQIEVTSDLDGLIVRIPNCQ
ncbi:2Fe-2S iron-sulfur cluster-binding protein [Aquisediminimonas profunda]|uniref:2Fe-2S iron-sulfur cluster-binding protein n=1 Tax=Aquisediminimonas profunda TaxID=1550733 RepID=UPI0031B7EE2F